MNSLKYLIVGIVLGITFVKAEIISWFRIQEMFHFHSFHMYGVIGTAVLVAMVSVQLIKRLQLKSIEGENITIEDKIYSPSQMIGGLIFGLGWAITGACPGPIFALVGNGFGVLAITFLSAVAGTWVYGVLRKRLPH